jgi:hypothetical protein
MSNGGSQQLWHSTSSSVPSHHSVGAGVQLFTHYTPAFRLLSFPVTTTSAGDCVYRTRFIEWLYMRDHYTNSDSMHAFSMKRSSQPNTDLGSDWTKHASTAIAVYEIILHSGPVHAKLHGPSSMTVAGPTSVTYRVAGSQGTGTYAVSWKFTRNGLVFFADECLDECTITVSPSDAPGIQIEVHVSSGPSQATVNGITNVTVGQDFSVSIAGPELVNPQQTCSWLAVLEGGVAPFTYSWSGIAWGSSNFVTASPSGGGALNLSVTDASGTTRWASLQVGIDATGSQEECDY